MNLVPINPNNIFSLFASFFHNVFILLDQPIIYDQITFLRLIIGFIILSAIITIFWKGAKG